MTQTKQVQSSDNFLLAINFRMEGRNLRGIVLRLFGVVTALAALGTKVWVWTHAKVP